MAPVEPPSAMAPDHQITQPNWGIVGYSKIGRRGVEVDMRASMVIKEGGIADIFLGRHALGEGVCGSASMC